MCLLFMGEGGNFWKLLPYSVVMENKYFFSFSYSTRNSTYIIWMEGMSGYSIEPKGNGNNAMEMECEHDYECEE